MSANYNELVNVMKSAAQGVMNNADLSTVCFGTVTSEKPLKVLVDQKFEIDKDNLVVPQYLTDFVMKVEINAPDTEIWKTENKSGGSSYAEFASHNHDIKGKKKLKLLNHLEKDDKVILIKQHGGQKYLVVDRIGEI